MAKNLSTVSEATLVKDVAFATGYPQREVRDILSAVKDEIVDNLVDGSKVNLMGLVRFTPSYVAAKKKGELVRNPATGEMIKRAAGVPASFRVKASASSAIKKQFPSVASSAGKKLESLLK
jgi:nucleoid DNA-binding protein